MAYCIKTKDISQNSQMHNMYMNRYKLFIKYNSYVKHA